MQCRYNNDYHNNSGYRNNNIIYSALQHEGNCIANILPPILKTKNFFVRTVIFEIYRIFEIHRIFEIDLPIFDFLFPLISIILLIPVQIIVDLLNSIFSLLTEPGILPAT